MANLYPGYGIVIPYPSISKICYYIHTLANPRCAPPIRLRLFWPRRTAHVCRLVGPADSAWFFFSQARHACVSRSMPRKIHTVGVNKIGQCFPTNNIFHCCCEVEWPMYRFLLKRHFCQKHILILEKENILRIYSTQNSTTFNKE